MSSSYQDFHTGIRRDPNNTAIWRRSSDNAEVQFTADDWYGGEIGPYPTEYDDAEFLIWYMGDNTVWNDRDDYYSYVCEFVYFA